MQPTKNGLAAGRRQGYGRATIELLSATQENISRNATDAKTCRAFDALVISPGMRYAFL